MHRHRQVHTGTHSIYTGSCSTHPRMCVFSCKSSVHTDSTFSLKVHFTIISLVPAAGTHLHIFKPRGFYLLLERLWPPWNKTKFWTGEMKQCEKHLLYKHEDLSLILRNHEKAGQSILNPSPGGTGIGGFLDLFGQSA